MDRQMQARIRAARKNEGGFTLIELLIVIVILGILAGVVIFASAGFKNKGAAEACKTTVSSVKTSVEAFHVDSATALFPANFANLTGGATPYFELNGITVTGTGATAAPATIAGKGWTFSWESGYAAGPPVVNNPPVPASYTCVLT